MTEEMPQEGEQLIIKGFVLDDEPLNRQWGLEAPRVLTVQRVSSGIPSSSASAFACVDTFAARSA